MKKILTCLLIVLSLCVSAHAGYWKETFSRVRVGLSAAQSITSSSETTIVFNNESKDALSEFNTTTGIFTAKYAGEYLVNLVMRYAWAEWSSGDGVYVDIYQDTTSITKQKMTADRSAYMHLCFAMSTTITLSAGDTIKVTTYQSSGSAMDVDTGSSTRLTIDRLLD